MLRLGFYIFALFAVLMQCSPLRSCALEYLLSGASCHTGEMTTSDCETEMAFAVDGCASHPVDSHDNSCTCEQPRASVDRVGHPVVGADFLPALVSGILVADPRAAMRYPNAPPYLASPPSVGRSLPLLI